MFEGAIPSPQLEKITAAIPGVVYQLRIDTAGRWEFRYLSSGIQELYEVAPEEAYADPGFMTSCILAEDLEAYRQSIAHSTAHALSWFHENRIRTRSGRIKWVRGQATPEVQSDGSVLWNGLLTDITGQKHLEDELHDYHVLLERRSELLASYQRERVAEERLAKRIIDKLIAAHLPDEPCVRHWTRSHDTFNGDIIAYARSPKGLIYILFADAAGHGLPAAICAVPILPLFYRLVQMSLPIEAIARNLNQTFQATLPGDRFVSACLTTFNSTDGHVRLWNAGMPDVLHVDANGHVLRRYESRNPPLGIVDFTLGANSTAGIYMQNGERLIYVSDGVIEAGVASGSPFGLGQVEQLLASRPPDQFMPCLQKALDESPDSAGLDPFHDDASVLELICSRSWQPQP